MGTHPAGLHAHAQLELAPEVGHGPATIVDDGETGWLVPPDDEEALAAAMLAAATDDGERRRRGEAAYKEARSKYSWPALAERLARVYDEVREEGPAGR